MLEKGKKLLLDAGINPVDFSVEVLEEEILNLKGLHEGDEKEHSKEIPKCFTELNESLRQGS